MNSMNIQAGTEAEVWLLGGVFQDPRVMAQLAHALEPGDFLLEKHSLVWQAFLSLQKDGRVIDIITVATEIEKTGLFKAVFGGRNDYLFDLSESVPSSANTEHYAELVAKASALRKLVAALQTTLKEAKEPDAEADAMVSVALERISGIAGRSARTEDMHIADIARQVLDDLMDKMAKGVSAGASTGFNELDGLAGGLRPGEVVILGGRPGMGKTSFALDIAIHAAKTMPVKFFSMEMAKRQMIPKALCFFNRINLKRTINADLSDEELLSHCAAVEELRKHNLYAEFEAGMKIQEICADVHAFTARHGKGLIIIDHLHYLRTDGKNYENRNIELGKITHALKELAKKLDLPVLLLSQLNRALDRSPVNEKKPRLSDLRDSGNIEQDADMVWFVHRDGYYDVKADPSDTDIIIAKNRSGPTGTVKMHFDLNTTKFSNAQT